MHGDLLNSSVHRLAEPANGFHPAKAFFDSLPDYLADRVVWMAGCPAINGGFPVAGVLSYVRGDLKVAQLANEFSGVVPFVSAKGNASGDTWQLLHHGLGCFALGCSLLA